MALKSATKPTDQAAPDQAELASLTATPDTQAVACVSPDNLALGEFGGDTGDIQMRLPYLSVASGMGSLDAYVKGSVVLGDSLLAGPGKPIRITLLAARAYWKEYLGTAYSKDTIPRTFATKAEVLANGGTTDWTPGGKAPDFKLAVSAKALVENPEGVVSGLFGIDIGGTKWAPAMFNTDKTSASVVAPVIKSDTTFSLRGRGLYSGIYTLVTRAVPFKNGHIAWVPGIKLTGFHTDDGIATIKKLFLRDIETPVDVTDIGPL